jgi:hypothetical protein
MLAVTDPSRILLPARLWETGVIGKRVWNVPIASDPAGGGAAACYVPE